MIRYVLIALGASLFVTIVAGLIIYLILLSIALLIDIIKEIKENHDL